MKKISQIIAYFLLGAVVVGLILCAIIKVSYKPEISGLTYSNGDRIEISVSGTTMIDCSDENINYEKFNKIFNNSFKLTILYSLFSGHLNDEVNVDEKITTNKPTFVGYKVEFIYATEQVLKNNGKEVALYENSNKPITYTSIVFDVAEDKGLTEVTMYLELSGVKFKPVKTIANFDNLYTYISELSMFAEEE